MPKLKEPKAENVISLATFRETRTAPPSSSQGSTQQALPPWTHMEAAPWCLQWFDKEPAVAEILNEWEVNFLEDIATQSRPASDRQNRALNRILYIIRGMLRDLERERGGPNPAA